VANYLISCCELAGLSSEVTRLQVLSSCSFGLIKDISHLYVVVAIVIIVDFKFTKHLLLLVLKHRVDVIREFRRI
jgi:4-hydroxy-3-methylbut-2-en-1-yl diphosphate synthase IspG/GcpE